jgi:transcriptional regulator with XRE-family HTH domain
MTKHIYRLVGQNIKTMREARGFTQKTFAQAFKEPVTLQTVNNMETGRTSLKLHTLQEIADVLGCTIHMLFDDCEAVLDMAKLVNSDEADLLKAYRKIQKDSSKRAVKNILTSLANHLKERD